MDEGEPAETLVVPVVEERVVVSKETVETGRVRVTTHVEERTEQVREGLRHDDVVVERIPINRIVDTAPVIRREGDTVIYPVVEETLVVEKRLLLKEEIRIICKSSVETVEQQVILRAVHADVQRTPSLSTPKD